MLNWINILYLRERKWKIIIKIDKDLERVGEKWIDRYIDRQWMKKREGKRRKEEKRKRWLGMAHLCLVNLMVYQFVGSDSDSDSDSDSNSDSDSRFKDPELLKPDPVKNCMDLQHCWVFSFWLFLVFSREPSVNRDEGKKIV